MVTVTGIAPGASGVADGGECTSGAADRTRNGSLRVAAVFSDHMVLQRETPIAVFGTAPAGERVVASLTDAQGVTVAQTMAVGDTENDLAIIRAAGVGVAMGNATAAVKSAADYITTSNDEDGVAAAIAHFLRLA